MIVETMTYKEVFDELMRDADNVNIWCSNQAANLSKIARRKTRFPFVKWFDWVSPRNNHFICRCSIHDRKGYTLWNHLAFRHTKKGIEVFSYSYNGLYEAIPTVYLPHFFKRYKERCNIDKTGLDLIRNYFDNNHGSMLVEQSELFGKSVRYNGQEHKADCCKEGVALGHAVDGITLFKTFITYEMTGGLQKIEFQNGRNHSLKSDGESFNHSIVCKNIMEEVMNDITANYLTTPTSLNILFGH